MRKTKQWVLAAILVISGATVLTSSGNEDNSIVTPQQPPAKTKTSKNATLFVAAVLGAAVRGFLSIFVAN